MIKAPETPEISRIEKIHKSKEHITIKIKDNIFLISTQSVVICSSGDRINIPINDYKDIYKFVEEVINEDNT